MVNIATNIYKLDNKTYLFLTFFLSFFICSGQIEKNKQYDYDYIGNLTILDTILLTYRVKFDIVKTKITGVSYTDIGGLDETKSKIVGTYNYENNEMIFEESEILYTKSIFSEADFCFIYGKGKLFLKKNKSILKGNFVGRLKNKENCVDGKFYLIGIKSVEKKIEKLTKRVKKISKFKKLDQKSKELFKKESLMEHFKPSVLKSEENLSVFWKGKNAKIEIWDNQTEDGDIISIIHNGKNILTDYEIKKRKKTIILNLIKGKNKIIVIAKNEGLVAPNTATINLLDKNKVLNITTELNLNKKTSITLIVN